MRRNNRYYYDGTGNQRSEVTAERNLDGRRLRPLLALYGAGRTHFLRTTGYSFWMPTARCTCGSSQVALWAARDGVNVTGVDIAPNLVQRAQARARAEGLNARFMEGEAESLPFEDASFDVVISLVGVMFAPRPELVARELLRVCSPGGRIAMGNWTGRSAVTFRSSAFPACNTWTFRVAAKRYS